LAHGYLAYPACARGRARLGQKNRLLLPSARWSPAPCAPSCGTWPGRPST